MDLSREKIISLAKSLASATTEAVIPTGPEVSEDETIKYFYRKFDSALDKFCPVFGMESIDIILTEDEVFELAQEVARVCTHGNVAIKKIPEYDSENLFLYVFGNALSHIKEQNDTKKVTADKIKAAQPAIEEVRNLFR